MHDPLHWPENDNDEPADGECGEHPVFSAAELHALDAGAHERLRWTVDLHQLHERSRRLLRTLPRHASEPRLREVTDRARARGRCFVQRDREHLTDASRCARSTLRLVHRAGDAEAVSQSGERDWVGATREQGRCHEGR